MVKKTLSIILSIVMMLSMVGTSVFAALPTDKLVVDTDTANDVTDNEVTTEGRWVDDFSQYTAENTTTFNNYPRESLSQTSEVFQDKNWATMFQIVDADTSENATNMALKILPIAQNVTFSPKSFTMTDGQMLRYSYDICFKDMITETGDLTFSAAAFSLGSNTGGATRFDVMATDLNGSVVYKLQYSWADKCTIDQNKWYRIIYYLSSDKKTMSAYFADATTGEIYFSVENYTHGSAINLITYNHNNAERSKLGGYCLIDNVELTAYTPANYAPAVIKKSITDTGVAIDAGTMEITFDQPVTAPASSSVSLTAEGKNTLTATVAKVSNKLNTYTLNLPAMEGGTTYTADLSGFLNSGSKPAENFTFTTAAAAPVVVSSTPANGETDVLADIGSATVTFDQAMPTYPATLTLAGGIIATVSTTDNMTFTLSWSEELEGSTTYSLSLADFKNAEGKSSSTEAISFTTEFTGIVTETDSFEEASLLRTHMEYKSTTSIYTPLETLPAGYGEDVTPLSFVEGYNGGNGLQLATGSTSGKAYLNSFRTAKAYSLAEGEKFVATWRFNVKEMAAVDEAAKKTGSSISIGCSTEQYLSWSNTIAMITTKDGKPFIYHNYDNVVLGRTLEEDHWYNVYYVVENGDQTIYVVDAQGENKGSLIWKRA
ncbi:MAG: Ig-like domain-containing protein, partial [Clostridia bacterium]|nr:Ig-like domain-containing protein [Clostridia bacterium]